jgi:hypothetical protein
MIFATDIALLRDCGMLSGTETNRKQKTGNGSF